MADLCPTPSLSPLAGASGSVPELVIGSGEQAERRFWEFFTVTIRNPNTRAAYARAAAEFCGFLRSAGVNALHQ
ncbi:MAG: integrase, partial [Pseudomonadota bacterium]